MFSLFNQFNSSIWYMDTCTTNILTYSLFHIKGIFGEQLFSTFSVHYPSITEYKFGRPATYAYHLYETPVSRTVF